MAESFITQCPHCGTSFRVRTEQLAVANGSVRCGACLQVFSARNHVVTTSVPAQNAPKVPTAAKKQAPKPPAAKQKPVPRPISAPAPKPKKPIEPEFGNFTSDDDDDTEFLFADGEDEDEFLFNDGPDDNLFDEDDQEEGFGELSDSFLNLNDSSQKNRKIDHFQKETQELEQDTLDDPEEEDESWAESILEEMENEEVKTTNPAVFEAREVGQKKTAPKTQTQQQSSVLMDFDHDFSIPPTASQVVNKASQEIDLDFHADERLHRLRPLGWLVIVILLILLAGQFAWLQKDTYARMDQWRGLYQKACDTLGCELPEQIDLNSIRTSVLVREHKDPRLKDIRIVDIVLTNKAPFKQVFPVLLLQYTDVNGKLIADQMFYPDKYLKGELTGVELMPINTRIYISLPIRTPSKNAVNYQLLLNPAEG